jgi:HD-GYP domain-containing protein (c-di-GMP phosphodiesterase class II)
MGKEVGVLQKVKDKSDRPKSKKHEHLSALAVVLREEFGVPFGFYDAMRGDRLSELAVSDVPPGRAALTRDAIRRIAAEDRPRVEPATEASYQVAILIYEGNQPAFVAVGILDAMASTAAEAVQEKARLQKWTQSFSDRLRLANQFLGRHRSDTREEGQTALAWETILTVDQILRRLRIHKEPEKNHRRILQTAHELLGVETLIWVPVQASAPVLIQGKSLLSPWDSRQFTTLLTQNPELERSGLLILNDFPQTSWASRYPQVANVLIMPVSNQNSCGWILAINKRESSRTAPGGKQTQDRAAAGEIRDFRRSDAALLTPFLGALDLHLRSSGRYQDLKELLVGLTRSLTAAIDAKDSYTYGHSERVARVAVEIGRELGLSEEELSDIYLAGLLHDIGKIGIRDAVLTKRDRLTPEEFEHVKQHVSIGYKILADLRPIRNLLPGVLYHHERYDGTGYPDGLVGEAIPFLARILAVADGYDAMSTARPYRAAMPIPKVEEILKSGAGTQWDQRVIEAFLRCHDRVHAIRQRGVGESLCQALDGALRSGGSSCHTLEISI